jgi:hypothetical protein
MNTERACFIQLSNPFLNFPEISNLFRSQISAHWDTLSIMKWIKCSAGANIKKNDVMSLIVASCRLLSLPPASRNLLTCNSCLHKIHIHGVLVGVTKP